MFLQHICQNIDILAGMNDQKNNLHGNKQTQGQKRQLKIQCIYGSRKSEGSVLAAN